MSNGPIGSDESSHGLESRVLVLPAVSRDGELTQLILMRHQIPVRVCANVQDLVQEIKHGAGTVMLAKEAMDLTSIQLLTQVLEREPVWSHLPFVVLTEAGELSDASQHSLALLDPIKNVTFLERPVRILTLVGVLRAALADRARQYDMRKLMLALEKSNASLFDFASIASHDLKEPLRTITTYIQLFLRKHKQELDADSLEQLGFAADGAKRMQVLISDLLTYSCMGADQLEFSAVNTGATIDRVLKTIEVSINDAGAQIVRKGVFPEIQADDVKISRLFQNLLSNAIKFRRSTVSPLVEITGQETENETVFSFKDNGIGIATEDIPTVFAIFRRLNSTALYPGSGIGLATCQKIIERHQGRIVVESTLGQGSTFSVHIPKRLGMAQPSPRGTNVALAETGYHQA